MNNKTTMRLFMAMLAILTLTMAGCANLFGSDDDDDDGDSAAPTLTEWEVIETDSSGLGSISERTATYNGVQETQRLVVGTHYDDVTFSDDYVWYLGGAVFIGNNAQDPDEATGNTLTIEPGTTIRGNTSAGDPGVLIITRGSDIVAEGTADNPITMTSANPIGERAAGDWGGLIINGYARVQGGYAEGEGDTGEYGGGATTNIDNDNSGTIRYLRVQFAGTLFSPDNELNGIVLQGVGSGTTIEYVQVHKNADDGIEWFGGSAQVKYYVGTGNEDDSADGDDGWNGSLQHAILQHYPATGTGSLIEADGDAEDDFAPSNAVFANITAIGSSETSIGLRFKSDANYDMYNSVIDVQENDDTPGYVDAGGALIDYFGTLVVGGTPSDDSDNADLETPNNGNELRDSESGIEDAVAVLTDGVWSADFDVQPTLGDVTVATVPDADDAGNELDDTDYIGAYDGSNAWWEGWTEFPAN